VSNNLSPGFAAGLRTLALLLVTCAVLPGHGHAGPLPTDSKILFLHHSTGGVIWGGGVPAWFSSYNTAHGTTYAITELAYPDSPYPWDNYPYDYWNIWVSHAGGSPYMSQSTLEMLTPTCDVIVFKHCFPVSGIGPDTGHPNVASASKTLENYKLQYAALKAKLRSFPANRFVVWTGAALRAADTSPEQAARAKQFFDWVRDTWDEPGDNIFVWDFFALETDGGMYLTPEHASGDSHPNSTFAAEVAPLFSQRVVDVILGRGDSTSVVGAGMPPAALAFSVAGPNPFAGRTRLRFELPSAARVSLAIYDVSGRRVARLAEGDRPAGRHEAVWDSRQAGAPAGVYFARLAVGRQTLVRRVVALK
jgi:hypothetical protein